MRNRYLYITLLSILGFNAETYAQAVAQAPQLVVSISIDQLRTDQLETYAPLYTSDGLKRLLTEGLLFPHAAYPFQPVDRASAVASLTTGSTPYYNSIIGCEWLDRNTLRPVSILHDEHYKHSPHQLAVSTIGDELKIATEGAASVYSFAWQAENAILSAGHAANGAAWISNGKWEVTNYYTPTDTWLASYRRQHTPTADANQSVTEIALKCTEQMGLGLDNKPDLLFVGYSVTPTQDGYLALDRTVAKLFNGITQQIPMERVLFVLTGTEVREEEERQDEKYRVPTGNFNINRTANLLNLYLGAVYGSARYIEACYHNQIFLSHKLIEKNNINKDDVLRRAQEFLLQLEGVRNVYTAHQLLTSDSQRLERIRNGYNVKKCGDLLVDIAPGWKLTYEDSRQSTTSRANVIPIPIIFFGAGIQPQRISEPVTIDRIAPTIARTIHIRAPNACSAEPLF